MNFWQTSRIRLRAIEPSDAEILFRWNQDSDRARFLDFVWPPTSLASVQAWTEEKSKGHLEDERFHWMIETLSCQPIGTISTHNCNPHTGTFSYGIDIASDQRRQGYATEAIWLVLRYYFLELRYQKVTVPVHADNLASIRLHEALGFQREGMLRRMTYQHGQYLDELYFGLTIEEFRELDPHFREIHPG